MVAKRFGAWENADAAGADIARRSAQPIDMKAKSGVVTGDFSGFELDRMVQDFPLEQTDYKAALKQLHLRLLQLQFAIKDSSRQVILVFEGPDAAGKGGAIKRLVEKLDPRTIRVYSTLKPTAEEYAHHYMRRFWLRLPSRGQIAIFDRSWYGRVLVERVEGFATDKEWKRAYREINEFEQLLTDGGAIFIKIYIHISKDEQLKRFKKRESDPTKHWKINEEDWRNRKKWDEHNKAAEDMFRKTSTEPAPWYVIPGNYKWNARVATMQIVVETLEARLGKSAGKGVS